MAMGHYKTYLPLHHLMCEIFEIGEAHKLMVSTSESDPYISASSNDHSNNEWSFNGSENMIGVCTPLWEPHTSSNIWIVFLEALWHSCAMGADLCLTGALEGVSGPVLSDV
jgi:hypothetical protein